jgi:hypothetical protein
VDSLGEILFGLIMVLTFTLGAGLAGGHERGLLLAAIGCNVAWGVIDAVLFVLGSRFERRRRNRFVRTVRRATDQDGALAAIRDEFDPELAALIEPADRERLYRAIHASIGKSTTALPVVTREDWMAGLWVFVLVTATALPAALPFFLVRDPQLALRLSNALLVGLLFLVGFRWGRYIDLSPWRAGLVLAALGVALVLVAIALGG